MAMFTKPSVSDISPPVSATISRVARATTTRPRAWYEKVASTRCSIATPAGR